MARPHVNKLTGVLGRRPDRVPLEYRRATTSRTRVAAWRLVAILLGLGALVAGWETAINQPSATSAARPFSGPAPVQRAVPAANPNPAPEIQTEDAQFARVVAAWNSFIVSHDGYLPEDPYSAILGSGAAAGMKQLRWYDFGVHVPPRINSELKTNLRWHMFVLRRDDLGQCWVCYGDGSWERISEAATVVSPFRTDGLTRLARCARPVIPCGCGDTLVIATPGLRGGAAT
jgi:hypothetical protein